MCPTQWFTPTRGFFHSIESVLAHTAHTRNGPPIPGPFVKHITEMFAGVSPACSSASLTRATRCCAAK
jgi:hypothetical protein